MVNPVGNVDAAREAAPVQVADHVESPVPAGAAAVRDGLEVAAPQVDANDNGGWENVFLIGIFVKAARSISEWASDIWNSFLGLFGYGQSPAEEVVRADGADAEEIAPQENALPAEGVAEVVVAAPAFDVSFVGLVGNAERSMHERLNAALNLVGNAAFLENEEARVAVGAALAGMEPAIVGGIFAAVWDANGRNDEGLADFGQHALAQGRFLENEGVQAAIRAAATGAAAGSPRVEAEAADGSPRVEAEVAAESPRVEAEAADGSPRADEGAA